MDWTQAIGLMLAPSGACYAPSVGQLDEGRRVFQSPETYRMYHLLAHSAEKDRFYRVQRGDISNEGEAEFIRLDEAQFLRTARQACIEAYYHVLTEDEDLRKILLDTGTLPITYQGGFRPYVLDASQQNGYGYDIVGKTLIHLRTVWQRKPRPTRKDVLASPIDSQDPSSIGLIVLCIAECWTLLTHAQDDLTRFLGRSAFEILNVLRVSYDEALLRKWHSRLMTAGGLSDLDGLAPEQIRLLVENEIVYPGNLAGFLRKQGIRRYLTALRAALHRRLWHIVAQEVLAIHYPAIPPAQHDAYIAANSPPEIIDRQGKTLVDLFLAGKWIIPSTEEQQIVSETLRILKSTDFVRDALFYVPRLYILQHLGEPIRFLALFDFVDYEDMADALSPSYVRNLVINGRLFPTVLHYILFRTLSNYFPHSETDRLYKASTTRDGSPLTVYNNTMQQQFQSLLDERRRELLYDGIVERIRGNPVFLALTFYTSPPALPTDKDVQLTDADVALRRIEDTKTIEFPELTQFLRTCYEHEVDLRIVEVILEFWIAVWPKILAWSRFSRLVFPTRVRRSEVSFRLFFQVFYKDDLTVLHDLLPDPTPPRAAVLTDTLVAYLCSLNPTEGRALGVSTVLRGHVAAYVTAALEYPIGGLPLTFVCRDPIDPLPAASSSPASIPLGTFYDELHTFLHAYTTASINLDVPWDDRILLYMQYFILGHQTSTQLLPEKRTLVIRNKMSQVALRPSLWVSPQIMERFAFLRDLPDLISRPEKTLLQISHLYTG